MDLDEQVGDYLEQAEECLVADDNKAEFYLLKFLELNTNTKKRSKAYLRLGEIYQRTKQEDLSDLYYRKALEEDPENKEAEEHLKLKNE